MSHTPQQVSHTLQQVSHTRQQVSHSRQQVSHTPQQVSHTPKQVCHTLCFSLATLAYFFINFKSTGQAFLTVQRTIYCVICLYFFRPGGIFVVLMLLHLMILSCMAFFSLLLC